ncbi:MAG: Rieske 2Fe-2S domain-containing protein [Magnetococcales bacterium]|nr:Rieske 2Fe-2S domain-containing protein [Magnetococcales bacterium]
MSKALRYLAGVRPDAAGNLMGFYKHSVQALDDKTRHLIQIVTKVAVGTERGLRQYAPKALKSGASKEEILDAVLMAFPASGLNKMLDAIDVLNDLDLLPPLPAAEAAPPPETPVLGSLADFPEHKMQCVHRQGGDLIVYRTGPESVRVYASRCPHAKASLCKGVDHGSSVECRVHNWQFDLASGQCLGPDPVDRAGLTPVAAAVRDGQVVLTL